MVLTYWRRVLVRAIRETGWFAWNKIFVGLSSGVLLRIGTSRFRKLPMTWAEIGHDLFIVLGCYFTVIGVSFLYNVVRAPALMDREKTSEIGTPTNNLELAVQTTTAINLSKQKQRETSSRFASLMAEGQQIQGLFAGCSVSAEFNEHIPAMFDWIGRTATALDDIGLHTDAMAFLQTGDSYPPTSLHETLTHLTNWGRHQVEQLIRYRQKLQEIVERRGL